MASGEITGIGLNQVYDVGVPEAGNDVIVTGAPKVDYQQPGLPLEFVYSRRDIQSITGYHNFAPHIAGTAITRLAQLDDVLRHGRPELIGLDVDTFRPEPLFHIHPPLGNFWHVNELDGLDPTPLGTLVEAIDNAWDDAGVAGDIAKSDKHNTAKKADILHRIAGQKASVSNVSVWRLLVRFSQGLENNASPFDEAPPQ